MGWTFCARLCWETCDGYCHGKVIWICWAFSCCTAMAIPSFSYFPSWENKWGVIMACLFRDLTVYHTDQNQWISINVVIKVTFTISQLTLAMILGGKINNIISRDIFWRNMWTKSEINLVYFSTIKKFLWKLKDEFTRYHHGRACHNPGVKWHSLIDKILLFNI